jgi:hypothetical protein
MTKKSKRSQKAAKHSKRPNVAAQPEDEPDTATRNSALHQKHFRLL